MAETKQNGVRRWKKSKRRPYSSTRVAARGALMYAVLGVLWILFSDRLLGLLVYEKSTLMLAQTYKGWFFVAITAVLLFLLMRSNRAAQDKFEESLRVSRSNLDGVFRMADSVAFILSRRHGETIMLEDASPGARRLLGLNGDILGRKPQDVGLPAALFAPGQDNGGMAEIVFADGSGAVRYLLAGVLELEVDGEEGRPLLSIALDVTEKKQAEAALKAAHGVVRSAIDSIPSILVGVDEALRVTHWNAAATEQTGIPADEALGRPLPSVLPLLERYSTDIGACAADKRCGSLFITRYAPDTCPPLAISTMRAKQGGEAEGPGRRPGSLPQRHFEVQVFPLTGLEGGAVVRVDDVTERVRLQELLVQTEKMMSVGRLAAGMAHEINNPLGGVLQGMQNVVRRLSPDFPANHGVAEETGCDLGAVQRYMQQRGVMRILEGVVDSGKRAAEIVAGMLEFSCSNDLSHSSVDLNDLLHKTLDKAMREYHLDIGYDLRRADIRREFGDGLPMVRCSRIGMEQVVGNLLRNAAQAVSEHCDRPDWHPRIIVRSYMEGGNVVVEVEDNGPGMSGEEQRRVFEPFYTTRPVGGGTGLGLAVAYYIVTNNHRGRLEVDTDVGDGALFRIFLSVE